MQLLHILMRDPLLGRLLLDVAEASKVVEHFTRRALRLGRKRLPLFEQADLLQRERVALDRSRAMGVSDAGVLLEGGNPWHLHRRRQDLFP